MKKLLSVILSIMMVAAISTSFAMQAMAADVNVYSPQGTAISHSVSAPRVNKAASNQIKGTPVANGSNQITFTYTGTGELTGWQIIDANGNVVALNEGAAAATYKVISLNENSITIEVLDWDAWETPDGYTVNAVVTETTTAASGTPADTNTSSTSPSTGVASVAFASVAAAGAGVAALALLKKKDAE